MADFFKNLKDKLVDPYDEEEEVENAEYEEEEEVVTANTSDYEEPTNKQVKKTNAKMIVTEPRSYEDAKDIGECLLKKKACVVNIHRLQDNNATRLLDFLTGVTFAINGSFQKIDKNVFLFAPNEMPVDGVVDTDAE